MLTKDKNIKKVKREEKALLTFLQKTKEGSYAPVDTKYIVFSRTTQEYSMIVHSEQEYYYSLS